MLPVSYKVVIIFT